MDWICLDTTVLLDFLQSSDKTNSFFYSLVKPQVGFRVPEVVANAIRSLSERDDTDFIYELFQYHGLIDKLHIEYIHKAEEIRKKLEQKGVYLSFQNLLIAATALCKGIPLATLRPSTFEGIENLTLITPQDL